MKDQIKKAGQLSRRKFLGTAATAAAAISVMPIATSCSSSATGGAAGSSQLNSNFAGVRMGNITYSFRSMEGGIDNVIKYCVESGCSNIELMSTGIEEYLGAPTPPPRAPRAPNPPPPPAGEMAGPPPQRPAPTPPSPEETAAREKYAADISAWRLSADMSMFENLGKKFNDAGVDIHIVKWSPANWPDAEIDYAFMATKAMGAKGISQEIGEEAVNKLGPIAEKHGMYAVFHNHAQFAEEGFSYDPFLAVSPAVMMNFDMGHFFGTTGIHPNTMIEKYHDRIFSIHIKDKTGHMTDPPNANQVWGQGETPIADVLNYLKDRQSPIYVDIELEYPIAPWSNAVKEVKTCIDYARQILM